MAAKKNYKAKKSSMKKDAAAAAVVSPRRQEWPCSELPPTTNFRQHSYRLLISTTTPAGLTKSRPPPSTRCDAGRLPRLRHVPTAIERRPNPNPNPNPKPNPHFLADGASIAHAVYKSPKSATSQYWCYLRWDTQKHIPPPPTNPLPGLRLSLGWISLGPNVPTSALVVDYSITRDIVRPRSYWWFRRTSVRHDCTTPDPFDHDKKPMEFTRLLHFGGKCYAMSLQGALAVMQVIDTRLRITAVGPTRALPSSDSRFFREYFFQMDGEIFLVFLVHERSLAVVDRVEVLRLDLDKLCWIRVERLKGRAVFLDERCICVDMENFGCRDDHVYFVQGLVEKRWKVFDMKTSCILPVLENEWHQTMVNMYFDRVKL